MPTCPVVRSRLIYIWWKAKYPKKSQFELNLAQFRDIYWTLYSTFHYYGEFYPPMAPNTTNGLYTIVLMVLRSS